MRPSAGPAPRGWTCTHRGRRPRRGGPAGIRARRAWSAACAALSRRLPEAWSRIGAKALGALDDRLGVGAACRMAAWSGIGGQEPATVGAGDGLVAGACVGIDAVALGHVVVDVGASDRQMQAAG